MLVVLYISIIQAILGAFDTLYYHEYIAKLPSKNTAKFELKLHASRDFAYAVIFITFAWLEWNGVYAWLFSGILLFEIIITMVDFIEEDISRKLPPGERVMHTVMAILYGAMIAYLIPHIIEWGQKVNSISFHHYGILSWILTLLSIGVFVSGIRDAAVAWFNINPIKYLKP